MTDFTIGTLNVHDFNKGFLQLLEQLTTVESEKIKYLDFCDHFSKMKSIIYVVRKDDKVVATASLLVEPKFIHGLSFAGHIEDVVVDKSMRGTGVGKILIDHLVKEAEKQKCYKVILDCEKHNIPFYKKCGFQSKGFEMVKYLNMQSKL